MRAFGVCWKLELEEGRKTRKSFFQDIVLEYDYRIKSILIK